MEELKQKTLQVNLKMNEKELKLWLTLIIKLKKMSSKTRLIKVTEYACSKQAIQVYSSLQVEIIAPEGLVWNDFGK